MEGKGKRGPPDRLVGEHRKKRPNESERLSKRLITQEVDCFIDSKTSKRGQKKRHWYRVPNKGKEGKSPAQPSPAQPSPTKIYTGTGLLKKVKKAKTYYKPTPAHPSPAKSSKRLAK